MRSAAESGAVSLDLVQIEDQLSIVIEAWRTLAEATRESILALVRAGGRDGLLEPLAVF